MFLNIAYTVSSPQKDNVFFRRIGPNTTDCECVSQRRNKKTSFFEKKDWEIVLTSLGHRHHYTWFFCWYKADSVECFFSFIIKVKGFFFYSWSFCSGKIHESLLHDFRKQTWRFLFVRRQIRLDIGVILRQGVKTNKEIHLTTNLEIGWWIIGPFHPRIILLAILCDVFGDG